jgi:hypothetical protein
MYVSTPLLEQVNYRKARSEITRKPQNSLLMEMQLVICGVFFGTLLPKDLCSCMLKTISQICQLNMVHAVPDYK